MVSLEVVQNSNAKTVHSQPLVAVFVGGTAGIGSYAVRALATTHGKSGKGLRVYIVGRKKDAADAIISECREACPDGQFNFVRAADLTLLKDVDRVCEEIIDSEQNAVGQSGDKTKIDLLVLSQGILSLDSRNDTVEGLDRPMALVYYSRMRFIVQLLPLLLESPLAGRVVSVLNPTLEGKLFSDDLSLRDPKHFGIMTGGSHVAYMTSFFMENLAARNPGGLSLSHYYPGFVWTNSMENSTLPAWFKWIWRWALGPLLRPFAVPESECGQRVVFFTSNRFAPRPVKASEETTATQEGEIEVAIASDGRAGGGAYRVNWNGETYPTPEAYKKHRDEGLSDKIWNHTIEAFGTIEAGNAFAR